MFGFGKEKKTHEVPKELTEVRDCLIRITGVAIDMYSATMLEYLTHSAGKTGNDVKQDRERMLKYLRRYVRSEILL